jgi:transcriptional regulator with XRE-family HTH domain
MGGQDSIPSVRRSQKKVDLRLVSARETRAEAPGEAGSLGRRLKALRAEQGTTLAQLGDMVGLSASYLSQIERNRAKPSLAALSSIAETLGVQMRFFFEHPAPVWEVVRKGRGDQVGDGSTKATFEILSSEAVKGRFEPYRVTCWPAMEIDADPHPGEEFAFILDGQLEVGGGEEVFDLREGDSIHYQGSQPHTWRNSSGGECTLIWAFSPPLVPSIVGK